VSEPLLHVILFQPEIPQNTGNIGRTCAISRLRLHLIHPLGFVIKDKHLKRSGMDYWKSLDLEHHESWEEFLASDKGPSRIFLFTTKGECVFWDVDFRPGDGLLFGNEGYGAPAWLHESVGEENRLAIPQYEEKLRSLNLATSVGVAVFEALRQLRQD